MTNEPDGLQDRLSLIEGRLNQIERHLVELGIDEPTALPLADVPELEESLLSTEVLASPEDQAGSEIHDESVVAASLEETPVEEPSVTSGPVELIDRTFVEENIEPIQVSSRHESKNTSNLDRFAKDMPAATTPFELIVGGKWMAWIGAAAVVASVVFFLKLAYDQGWWDSVSPVSRCLMAAAFGVAMIGGGEFCLRKISKAASVGLFGAGLSVLYLVAWAASARYQVVSMDVSFLLMAVVAVGGFAVTLRSKFMTIGVLSLVGGYAAPMLLNGLAGSDVMLLGYLTTLLAIALALAAAAPSEFRVLRFLAFGMHSIPAFVWLASSGGTHWVLGIIFMTVWWSMVLGESLLAALRDRSTISNIVATLLSTAAYVTAGAWLLNGSRPATRFDWLSIFTVAIAIVSGAIAMQFWSGLDVLRGRARAAIDLFSVALVAQAGVLLAVAVAFRFQGYGESIGWLALALGSIEIARRIPSRGIGVFGLIVGALAVVRVFSIDWLSGSALIGTTLAIGPVSFSAWSVLAMTTVFAVHLAARRLGIPDRSDVSLFRAWRVVPTVLTVASAVGWVVISGHETSGDLLTIAGLLLVVILFAAWCRGTHLSYFEIGLSGLVLVAGKWLFDAAVASGSSQSLVDAAVPLLNSQMGLAVAIVAIGFWAFLIIQNRAKIKLGASESNTAKATIGITMPAQIALIVGAVLFLIALSFEIDRIVLHSSVESVYPGLLLRGLWWTLLWPVGGMVMFIVGKLRNLDAMKYAGVLIMVIAALVWLSVETGAVRMRSSPFDVMPILNLQFLVGASLAIMLGIVVRLRGLSRTSELSLLSVCAIGTLGLWLGSLEIDRIFACDATALQTGLSVYWCIYAVGLILLGFARRVPMARYVGIGLFGITTAKVIIIDLSQADVVWRVVSFLVLGLLLIGTSVVYARFAPKILRDSEQNSEQF